MSIYLIVGAAMFITAVLVGLFTFAYRAGIHTAKLKESERDASLDEQTALAARRMNEAQTNGIRSNNQLLDVLRKGDF
ncbi:hypothetical protein GS501_04460 [Saccharibacter sp. 17.LH.SD]|uniref:hypothetical protein n=1 Tax=Saccharibacter sp. 17.LH.SD TaxID=2689393 RepID=UPI001367A06C|nr:hypothetical protein [Saccharibacter sp. 17.LH.SD]MXV44298.1 hypothetical protein [Saccharibacter sp. 17.LH.SD]